MPLTIKSPEAIVSSNLVVSELRILNPEILLLLISIVLDISSISLTGVLVSTGKGKELIYL